MCSVFHASKPLSPVIIYLPSGPTLTNSYREEEDLVSSLQATSSATIARINYRASSTHQYPTPCHDVLFAFDWIVQNLVMDELGSSSPAPIGVCGQLIGGSLATMLALTECRLGERGIGAAAVNNPIVDWVFPDTLSSLNTSNPPEATGSDETSLLTDEQLGETQSVPTATKAASKRPRKKAKSMPLTAWQSYGNEAVISSTSLSTVRTSLFRRPEDFFDRFASPIHFFRSPHAQLLQPRGDDVPSPQQPKDHSCDMETQCTLDHYTKFTETLQIAPELPMLTKCRPYARSYPSAGIKLNLPVWNITTGSKSMLSDQTLELTKMLRRSIASQLLQSHTGRARWHDSEEKEKFQDLARKRVQLKIVEGSGLWTHQKDNVATASENQELGLWMKKMLEPLSA